MPSDAFDTGITDPDATVIDNDSCVNSPWPSLGQFRLTR